MWFRNLRLYCLAQPFDLPLEDLESQLAENAFVPCASYEKSRLGWVSPMGEAAPVPEHGDDGTEQAPMLTHVVGNYIMLCAQKQERLLPASVVREATAEKVAEIEERQARKIYRKEKREIQDDVYSSLLPRAFTRSTRIYAYLSRAENLLVVDSASAPKAEEFLNLLRDTLGSFPVALPDTRSAPAAVMTRWLKQGKATDGFAVNEDCELVNQKDASNVIRLKGQELEGDEVRVHLDAGKQARLLGVTWKGLLSCTLIEDLSIRRLRFEDIREESDNADVESPAQKFDQEFALMTLQLTDFFGALFNGFGGMADPKDRLLPDNRDREA